VMEQGRMALLGTGRKDPVPAELFGNKAAMLARIASLSIRIPPAFVLGVSLCEDYFAQDRHLPADLPDLLRDGINYLEGATGRQFNDPRRPLLVSVRSGAAVSMPGMMSTVLNVGLTNGGVKALIAQSGNPRFGWDSYRRLIASYGEGVAHHDRRVYDRVMAERIDRLGLTDESELDSKTLQFLAKEYEDLFLRLEREPFPEDAAEQLRGAITAVLDSWASPRVEAYRRLNLVRGAKGTAVTVQAMVFGNMGFLSGSGVAFTRNPWTGTKQMVVDFRFGVQGEDVVSGEREADQEPRFRRLMPKAYKELLRAGKDLEVHLKDMQDLEFTVQEGELYLLQTRDGKRSPLAALKIAVELAEEGSITARTALERLEGIDLTLIQEQRVLTDRSPLAKGTPASVGIVTGEIVLSSARAVERAPDGAVILIKESLTPDDLPGVAASAGIVTAHGNRMAHAVVVARQLGKACVVNVVDLVIDRNRRTVTLGSTELPEGAQLSMDSQSGELYEGTVEVVQERPLELIAQVERWREERASPSGR
jgi:pyruvate, orthophosphate dikinase